jgi:DNA-binding transcriptional MerR regulator
LRERQIATTRRKRDRVVAMETSVITGFTEAQAVRLTGVSLRQTRYWAADRFFAPSLATPDLPHLRLYSFRDLVSLKVLNQLRNKEKIPLQELRRTKRGVSELGERLWGETTLYFLGKRVVFHNPATGRLEEAATGQGVLKIPLRVVTGDIQKAVDLARIGRRKMPRLRRWAAVLQLPLGGSECPFRATLSSMVKPLRIPALAPRRRFAPVAS